jgi:hypothetical protein
MIVARQLANTARSRSGAFPSLNVGLAEVPIDEGM